MSIQGCFGAPFFGAYTPSGGPVGAADAGLLLVIDQSLVEVAGTDGQAEEGRVVFEVLAVEADLPSVTSMLEKPMRQKPRFLRRVGHGLSGIRPLR